MMQIFFFLLLTAGLAANVFWTVYLFRKTKGLRTSNSVQINDVDARVERLLSEIHRVTSANVELLEGRIDALREVGGLADERLKRIRATLTDLEVLLNRVQRVKTSLLAPVEVPESHVQENEKKAETSPNLAAGYYKNSVSKLEAVQGLHRQGLTERQMAQKMGVGIAEIRFLLKMAEKEGASRVQEVELR